MARTTSPETRDRGSALAGPATIVALLAALAAVSIVSYLVSVRYTEQAQCEAGRHRLTAAVTLYRAEHAGQAPDDLEELRPYVAGFDEAVKCSGDGRMLLWDATTEQAVCTYPDH